MIIYLLSVEVVTRNIFLAFYELSKNSFLERSTALRSITFADSVAWEATIPKSITVTTGSISQNTSIL